MTQRTTNRKIIPCAQCHQSIKIGEWCVKDTADFGIELGKLEPEFYGFTVPDYDPTFDGYSNDETLLIHVNCTPAYRTSSRTKSWFRSSRDVPGKKGNR